MSGWTPEFEADLTTLVKDWLKQQGRTQADLRRNLRAVSTRMPALLEVLEREYNMRGLAGLADRCLLYTSPSPRDQRGSRMPSSA